MAVRKLNLKERKVNDVNITDYLSRTINDLQELYSYFSELTYDEFTNLNDIWTEEDISMCDKLARVCDKTVKIIRRM